MPRSSRALPAIPVKHTLIRKVLNITPPLETKLRAYIAYYTEQQGLGPSQAPSDADTIVALLENFLDRDTGFNQHVRSKTMLPRQSRKPSADVRKNPASASDGSTT